MNRLVVLDLEMCYVPKAKKALYGARQEIIEIGAVLVEDYRIVDTFKTYVAPEFGYIDTFIHDLTGISKQDTSEAPRFKEAFEQFLRWVPEDAQLVTWSESDTCQIRKEALHKSIEINRLDEFIENYIDCQVLFSEKTDSVKTYRLSEALVIADIDYDEGAHDALVDAHNTALLFIKLNTENPLRLSPYYTNKPESTGYNPFADLLLKYQFAG